MFLLKGVNRMFVSNIFTFPPVIERIEDIGFIAYKGVLHLFESYFGEVIAIGFT